MGLLRRGNRGGREGLTLLETMLALMMMSLLIVGVLGLLGSLLVASTKSSDMTAGTFVGQYLFEKAKVEGPPAPEGGISEGAEQILSHEEEHPVSFQYRMIWTLVAERESYEVHSVSTKNQYGSDLYHVEVQVWWMVKDAEAGRAEGGGRRAVTLERLISVAPDSNE